MSTAMRVALLLQLAVSFAIPLALSQVAHVPMTVTADAKRVEAVAIGSWVWMAGVRPGQAVEPWPSDTGAQGFNVYLGDVHVGVGAVQRVTVGEALLIGALLAAVAVLLRRLALPGTTPLLGLAAAVSLSPLSPALGLPLALPLLIVPALVVLTSFASTPRGASVALKTSVFPVLMMALFVGAVATPDLSWPWPILWNLPAGTALLVSFVGSLLLLRPVLSATRGLPRRVRFARLLHESIPIARTSRIDASNEERTRLASELHNSVLPELGMAMLEIDAGDPAGRARLDEISRELRQRLHERQLAVLERAGLVAALRGYVSSLPSSMTVELEASDGPKRPPPAVELAAYRIAQASIANALTHSGGDRVTVSLSSTDRSVNLVVADDGVGIDATAEQMAIGRGHIGLADTRGQAHAVSGALQIMTTPDEGTTIRFDWKA